jgi:hypothetical protein
MPFFYYLVCESIGTAATPGLLCQPRVIVKMIVENRWNVDWQGKPKFSEKTCPSTTFVHHKIARGLNIALQNHKKQISVTDS